MKRAFMAPIQIAATVALMTACSVFTSSPIPSDPVTRVVSPPPVKVTSLPVHTFTPFPERALSPTLPPTRTLAPTLTSTTIITPIPADELERKYGQLVPKHSSVAISSGIYTSDFGREVKFTVMDFYSTGETRITLRPGENASLSFVELKGAFRDETGYLYQAWFVIDSDNYGLHSLLYKKNDQFQGYRVFETIDLMLEELKPGVRIEAMIPTEVPLTMKLNSTCVKDPAIVCSDFDVDMLRLVQQTQSDELLATIREETVPRQTVLDNDAFPVYTLFVLQ